MGSWSGGVESVRTVFCPMHSIEQKKHNTESIPFIVWSFIKTYL